MENGNSNYGMGIQNCFFNPNCETIVDQRYLFDSALSSLVSSPSNSHSGIQIPTNSENIVLKELIGRLGSISNSGENMSTTNSCYNTPLNSPPKLNLSILDQKIHGNLQFPLPQFPKDSGFVERASKFSTFCPKNESFKNLGSKSIEESSIMETETGMKLQNGNTNNTFTNANGRKRKGKGKETVKDDKGVTEVESDAKRSKSNDEKKGNEKSTEPPKDYIHVRARRGQATDSHSLAERVRREKISERMKFLQDLVPGCNKVTGKAVMLDEIINYVQSLQKQVEFLSMKLATVNPRIDAGMEAILSKDIFRPRVSMPTSMNPFDASIQPFPYGFQSQNNGVILDGSENQFPANPLLAAMHRNSTMKPSHIDGFGEASTLWENDLQSVVKMALGQDPPQEFHGQMKVEL